MPTININHCIVDIVIANAVGEPTAINIGGRIVVTYVSETFIIESLNDFELDSGIIPKLVLTIRAESADFSFGTLN